MKYDRYDTIIIGSGLGGLVAGSYLSKAGQRVLIVERHNKVGGFATTFKRKDFNFEIGLHQMDGFGPGSIKHKIFQDLDVLDNVKFLKTPDFYHSFNRLAKITVPCDYEKAVEVLSKACPNQRDKVLTYFSTIFKIRAEITAQFFRKQKVSPANPLYKILYPTLAKYADYTVGQFVYELTDDRFLRIALLANVGYYHRDPESLNFIFFATAQAGYFQHGAYYIQGGSQKLSDHFATFIKKNGGEILLGHHVEEILLDQDQATGIVFYNRHKKDEKIVAKAENIIANCALPNVYQQLIPKLQKSKYSKKLEKMDYSTSMNMIHLGLSTSLKELGNKHYLTFFIENYLKKSLDLSQIRSIEDYVLKGFSMVDYSQIDAQLCPAGKGVGVLTFCSELSDWSHLNRTEYKEKKADLGEEYLKKLEGYLPGVRDCIEVMEISTPKTIVKFTQNTKGAIYGFSQINEQAGPNRPFNMSHIPGLFFASAWSNPGGGFTGAIMSGTMCADLVLNQENFSSFGQT